MTNLKETFTFFSNGENVNQIKNQAKKAHKNKEYTSRSSALNSITKAICDKSFNKAIEYFDPKSPFLIDDVLYLPLFTNGLRYIAELQNNNLKITDNFYIDISESLNYFNVNISYKNIEKADKGWNINIELETEHHFKNRASINVYYTDEGIVADLYYFEHEVEIDNDKEIDTFSPISLDTAYVAFDEMINFENIFSNIDFNEKESISDYLLSMQLNHTKTDQSTDICHYEGDTLRIVGCVTISNLEGTFLYGESVNELVDDGICTFEQLTRWLHGEEIDVLNDYEAISNPWFEIVDESSEALNVCIEALPSNEMDIMDLML